MPAKKPTTNHDRYRGSVAERARAEFPPSDYLVKQDEHARTVGRERTIQATLDLQNGILIHGPFIEVTAVAYDGNALEVARPVRLILTTGQAGDLADQLVRWVEALSVGGDD